MNTRLQVEHPVTEEITGVDLVEWQLRVASGEPLPKRQDELAINGWAIEARLYAEDPAKGFLPSVGRLDELHFGNYRWNETVRIETGVECGDEVSPFYDPMLAKLIVHRADRTSARAALASITQKVSIWPVKTNAGFLTRALNDCDFGSGQIDTGLIARKAADLVPSDEPSQRVLEAAAEYAVFHSADLGQIEEVAAAGRLPSSWRELEGFRLNQPSARCVWLHSAGKTFEIDRQTNRSTERPSRRPHARHSPGGLLVSDFGETFFFGRYSVSAAGTAATGALIAPMPGKVTAVDVTPGDTVTKGQRILTLEAMKMEHALVAPFDGTVAELTVEAGAQVQVDAMLARIEPAAPAEAPPGA